LLGADRPDGLVEGIDAGRQCPATRAVFGLTRPRDARSIDESAHATPEPRQEEASMLHALITSAMSPRRASARRGAVPHPADRALSHLISRLPVAARPRAQASVRAAAREAVSAFEAESPRCACGGTCPKCQAKPNEDERAREAESSGAEPAGAQGSHGAGMPTAGIEDDPVLEYSNGTTSCDRDTGTMTTTISNTKCTRPCTVAHEADHSTYRAACCRAYATARRAAIAAGDTTLRNTLTRRYNDWISATSDFSECRAYRVSVSFGERMERDLGCGTPTDENRSCCADVRSYLTSVRASRDSRCPGTDQACPDFS
jgi:hypothetical protein